ncbi:MAG: hypothetical protein F8N37_01270 [Telmatospirillum sp.]|nr:hypothetical protein [Telmatospirillum sp.]
MTFSRIKTALMPTLFRCFRFLAVAFITIFPAMTEEEAEADQWMLSQLFDNDARGHSLGHSFR